MMFKHFMLGVVGLGLLVGCVNTVTRAEQLEVFRMNCKNDYGFANETSKLIKCVKGMDDEARQIIRDRLQALHDFANKSDNGGSISTSSSTSSSSSCGYCY